MGKFQALINAVKLTTVEPYLFLILFSYEVRFASYQSLLIERACTNIHNYEDEICSDLETVSKEQEKSIQTGNNLYIAITLLSSLPAVAVAIFLGPWSDKYSRKYPLIISAAGLLLETLSSTALTASKTISPIYYVITAAFAGFTGGYVVSASSAFSYVADITDERSRPARYAFLEFSTIAAIVCGNTVGGQLFRFSGYTAVMATAPCSVACALLYAIFIVKETKPKIPKEDRLAVVKDLFRTDNIQDSFKTCTQKRPGNLRLQLWLLVWMSFSHRFVILGELAVEFPYAKLMYQWDVTNFSNAAIVYSISNALVTVTLVPLLSKVLKLHEAAIGAIGILSLMAEMVLLSVAYNVPMLFFAWLTGTMNNFASVAVKSRLSKLVRVDETGRVFSLLATCESLTPLLGTVIFLQIYNASMYVFPGLPFATAAVFLLPSLIIFCWMTKMPTVSLAEFAMAEEQAKFERPLQTISSNYVAFQEDISHEENFVSPMSESKLANEIHVF